MFHSFHVLYRRRVGAHKSMLVSFIGWHPRKVTFLSSFIHFFEALVPRVAKCAPQELLLRNVFFKQEAKVVYFTDKTGKHYRTSVLSLNRWNLLKNVDFCVF